MNNSANGTWKNKKVLFIGDSLTARHVYPEVVKEILGIQTFYHCKGGASLTDMVDGENGIDGRYDNYTDTQGILRPLTAEDVADMDAIVFFGGYNSRHLSIGRVGDRYEAKGDGETVAAVMQYCIDRIYEELRNADNLTCRLLIVTVDYSGKYAWWDADGRDEVCGTGSGKTLEAMANIQVEIARYNAIPVCDLFHTSGINPHTWCVYAAEPEPIDPTYSPYRLNEKGEPISLERIKYVKGESYYQWRDGKVVLEEYLGYSPARYNAPCPYNADQLHKSAAGYRRIGEAIAGALISAYGN
jgi:hypothetical protein